MTAKPSRPSLSEFAVAWGLHLHIVQRNYSANADEAASSNRLMQTCELVSRALLAHPTGTVADISGSGYWLTCYRGALHLIGAGLLHDLVDDDAILVGECLGLLAADLDNVEQTMRARLSNRFYLEFDPQRLDALMERAHPAAPDARLSWHSSSVRRGILEATLVLAPFTVSMTVGNLTAHAAVRS